MEPHLPGTFEISLQERMEKISLRAGLYLKPDLKKCDVRGTHPVTAHITAHLEDSLARNATRMVKQLFDETIIIENLDSEFELSKVDVIITPELTRTTLDVIPKTWPPPIWHSLIVIKWNILTPNGKILYVNSVSGEGTFRGRWGAAVNKCMELTITDQFEKASEAISSAKWWVNLSKNNKKIIE